MTRIYELEEKIADIKKRLPAHSARPGMLAELEELEEELAGLKSAEEQKENKKGQV